MHSKSFLTATTSRIYKADIECNFILLSFFYTNKNEMMALWRYAQKTVPRFIYFMTACSRAFLQMFPKESFSKKKISRYQKLVPKN